MTAKKQALASSDPAADQQARTDAAADTDPVGHAVTLAQQAERIVALEQQLAESSEALAAVQHQAAGLQAEVDALKAANESSVELINTLNDDKNALLLQVSERDTTIVSLTADKADLVAQVQAHAERPAAQHDEERLHNLWCEAGGKLGDFEAAKRFVASL